MAHLVLIRHGKTEFNQEPKRFTGFTDVSISKEGTVDAQIVGQKLKETGIQFSVAYTSWLKRAWETLDIVLPIIGQADLEIIKHPFLNERHYGDLQTRYHREMAGKYSAEQVHTWRRSYSIRPPGGESLEDVVFRAGNYLETEILPRVKNGENVLVSAHGNSIRAMIKYLDNVSDDDIVGREIEYTVPLFYEF
ncbi:2,3-bisphosphoglycerate-dependent phosphoglycerate mutase [Candidatus Woesebacteria bacterium]|nr:2,3-bisphosphoglycerate-dependent phosphoglycerate mutase [Candidatus Woesebacteria bacterium]MCD8506824.1 2,3-bisphosphoglycerate-dependent phosphoglycerate mutase [Candidatus Woesebacteria bacterium]MCD8527558.1 2,3-bisphosphoglycerate-dependent phosphoglycerate mutase [Candidatus Woesebacteria bacterium]MCD8546298.1 2,3-bisphosphoglycerate-dependent phosphoglycerate mutase [Candidatus Woesebacteria bacterium]